ncbi:hypothetical protein [Mesorhizobium sp. P5_C1]
MPTRPIFTGPFALIEPSWARKMAAEQYSARFKKPIDDPHVQMNVES